MFVLLCEFWAGEFVNLGFMGVPRNEDGNQDSMAKRESTTMMCRVAVGLEDRDFLFHQFFLGLL